MPPVRHLWWFVVLLASTSAAVVLRRFMGTNPVYSSFPSEVNSATLALRSNGYTNVAAMMDFYPDIFFLSTSSYLVNQFTVFALPDEYIVNCSLPSWAWKIMLQYHTIMERLPLDVLLVKTTNSCLSTVAGKHVAVTSASFNEHRVEVNSVPVTNPDIFLGEKIVIHGVSAPFSDPHCGGYHQQNTFLDSQVCSNSDSAPVKNSLMEVLQILHKNGFERYSRELNASSAAIIRRHRFNSTTILAPLNLEAEAYPGALFTWIVMRQIIVGRYYYSDLLSLPDRTRLTTLTGDQVIVRVNYTHLVIGKSRIIKPDLHSNSVFVVHGITTGVFIVGDEFGIR